MTEISPKEKQEICKSKVRVYVTYGMSGAYALGALGLIVWLMYMQKPELAIGIFSGLASTTAAIISFWFGSRGSAQSPRINVDNPDDGGT